MILNQSGVKLLIICNQAHVIHNLIIILMKDTFGEPAELNGTGEAIGMYKYLSQENFRLIMRMRYWITVQS